MYLNVFLTNLGLYNEGYLVGEWVELPIDPDDLEAVYKRIGINDLYEETFITDYETDIDGFTVGEYDSISYLNDIMEQLDDLERCGDLAHALAYYEVNGGDIQEAINNYSCTYLYEGMTIEETAWDIIDNCYPEVPPAIKDCIDIQHFINTEMYGYTETTYGTLSE